MIDVLVTVARDDGSRGFRPSSDSDRRACVAANEAGLLTTPRGAWGYRLTSAGRAKVEEFFEAERARLAAMRRAGFDPSRPVCELSDEEIERYKTWRGERGKGT